MHKMANFRVLKVNFSKKKLFPFYYFEKFTISPGLNANYGEFLKNSLLVL
jgi:hypothetical protein